MQKKTKGSTTAESAYQRGQVQFDASLQGNKMLDSPRGQNEGTCRSGEGGEGPVLVLR